MFRNDQPVCYDDRRSFEAMTSIQVQRSLVWETFASTAELWPENHCTVHKVISVWKQNETTNKREITSRLNNLILTSNNVNEFSSLVESTAYINDVLNKK